MDIAQKNSDDQALAKALADINGQEVNQDTSGDSPINPMPTPPATPVVTPPTDMPSAPQLSEQEAIPGLPVNGMPEMPQASDVEKTTEPAMPAPMPSITQNDDATAKESPVSSDDRTDNLAGIKRQAIDELRPLVGKLSLSAQEKFETYLLLIRSTDDKNLIAPAHEVALQITDEERRAQALLDIIKEIDFLSQPSK